MRVYIYRFICFSLFFYYYIISSLSAGKPRSLLERTDGTDVPLGDRLQLQGSRALPLALALAPHSPRNRHRSHPPRAREETAINLPGPGISSGNS